MSADVSAATTQQLVAELARRGEVPRCRCGKWQTYLGVYDADGLTWRCHGCRRAVVRCTCW